MTDCVASRAATNLIGKAAMLKLRQAYIAVVWEADTVQHQGCKRALERCKEDYQSACRDAADAWGCQIAAETERDRLKARRCHTCRHLRSGVKCMVCELLHIHTETTKTFGCTLWEEVETHESYG